ncbi:MAG: SMP-30/gluconolactonase/LRE family protein [Ignavibacteriales bacterium]|nr:SMP-30/gluconolactonase/LRE family protein [Ignavibacteriales bacterium]
MKHLFLLFCTALFFASCAAERFSADIASTDFTAENLFSQNIEGPAFDANGTLYVVNFERNGTVGKVGMDGSCELFVVLPEGSNANAIQFNSKNEMLLADWPKHNILRVNMGTKSVDTFSHTDLFNQPNDICINAKDQLFASDPHWNTNTGQLWRIDADGTPILLEDSMGTTNGICLSPDEKILYVNESIQRTVWKYDVDGSGNITNKRLLIEFPDHGMDGMKCDRDGNLYITRYGKGTIAVVSPDGKLLREVQLKGKNCSNLVFGGPDGRTVFVTLQDRKGMEKFRNNIPGKGY